MLNALTTWASGSHRCTCSPPGVGRPERERRAPIAEDQRVGRVDHGLARKSVVPGKGECILCPGPQRRQHEQLTERRRVRKCACRRSPAGTGSPFQRVRIVGLSGAEHHLVPKPDQPAAEGLTDRSGTEHSDPHWLSLFPRGPHRVVNVPSLASTTEALTFLQGWPYRGVCPVARLIESALVAPGGRAAVGVATANATLTALRAVEDLIEPQDLGHELDAEPAALRRRDALPWSMRRAILEWIASAMTDTTRAARLERTARDAAIDIFANQ
jgi:hypothetical protein